MFRAIFLFEIFEPGNYLNDTVCLNDIETIIDTAQLQRYYSLNMFSRSGSLGFSSCLKI